jgi:photosystem II stability/assembly factor-like uncharacterized protein
MKRFLFVSVLLNMVVVFAQTTWYEINTNTTKKLNTVNFPTSQIGYIGGNDSLLMKSIDGGETWDELLYTGVTYYPGNEHILNLKFVSESVGYMTTGPYGGAYKTVNGGITWTQLSTISLCFNEGLFFFDEQNGFIGGSACFEGEKIDKMTSGVIASTIMSSSTNNADNRVVDIDFLDSDFGLAASYSGYFLRTIDGGNNWDTIPSSLAAGIPLTSVAVINDTLAYAGYDTPDGSGFGILVTVDGGLTWSMDLNWATFYYPDYLCVHETGDGSIYSGAYSVGSMTGLIFETTDFVGVNYYTVDQPIHDMTSYGDTIVFGIGDSGYVVVNQPPSLLSLDENLGNPMEFSVYPNPAQETISLITKSEQSEFAFTVFNSAGLVVLQGYTVDRNVRIENLPAGVFFIEISADNFSGNSRFVKL